MFVAWLWLGVGLAAEPAPPEHPVRDAVDLGGGLRLGVPLPGAKIRAVGITRSGFLAGVDLDAGSLLLVNAGWGSVLLGGAAAVGRAEVRAYGRVGLGYGAASSIFGGGWQGALWNAGGGLEVKPKPWLGIGLEGDYHRVMSEGIDFPSGAVTVMFYAI